MVIHQAVRMDLDTEPFDDVGQPGEKSQPVEVVEVRGLMPRSPVHHMVPGTRVLNA